MLMEGLLHLTCLAGIEVTLCIESSYILSLAAYNIAIVIYEGEVQFHIMIIFK